MGRGVMGGVVRYYGVEKTLQLEVGEERRSVHDDISVIVIWLQGRERTSGD